MMRRKSFKYRLLSLVLAAGLSLSPTGMRLYAADVDEENALQQKAQEGEAAQVVGEETTNEKQIPLEASAVKTSEAIPEQINGNVLQKSASSLAQQNQITVDGIIYGFTADEKVYVQNAKSTQTENIILPEEITDSTGKKYPVTAIGVDAFRENKAVKTVEISDSIESIGSASFVNCTSLEEIKMGKSVKLIDTQAFFNCSSLKNISISDSVTEIGYGAFANCVALEEAKIGTNVESIGTEAFGSCKSLTEIIIPDRVEELGERAFSGCEKLNDVKLGRGIKSIGAEAFASCKLLEKLTIPDNVTDIGERVFISCTNLKEVTIGKKVSTIGAQAFVSLRNLERIELPESVETIGEEAFNGCVKLESVVFNEGLVSISDKAFKGCNTLTEAIIPDSVTQIGNDAFAECTKINKLQLGSGLKTIGAKAFYGSSMEELIIPDNVETIGDSAFARCYSVSKVTIGSGLAKIPQAAFENCTSLTDITIPDTITEISDTAFAQCSNLKSVTLTDSIEALGKDIFLNCNKLTELVVKICKDYVVESDTKINGIDIPNGKTISSILADSKYNVANNSTKSIIVFDEKGNEYKLAAGNTIKKAENTSLLLYANNKPITDITLGEEVTLQLAIQKPKARSAAEMAAKFYLVENGTKTLIGSGAMSLSEDKTKLTAQVTSKFMNIGTQEIFVEYGMGNLEEISTYAGEGTFDVKVRKAIEPDYITIAEQTYNGTQMKPEVSVNAGVALTQCTKEHAHGTDCDGDFYVSAYGENVKAGTGSVTVVGVNNYIGTAEKNFIIKKAQIQGSAKEFVFANNKTNKYKYDLSQLLPSIAENQSFGEITYAIKDGALAGPVLSAKATLEAENISLPVKAVPSDTVQVLTISFVTDNFEVLDTTLTLKAVDVVPVHITGVTMDGGIYNGKSFTYSGEPVVEDEAGNVIKDVLVDALYEGTGDTAYASKEAPKDAGTYKLVLSAESEDGLLGGTTEYAFEIQKKGIQVIAEHKTIKKGDKLPELTVSYSGFIADENKDNAAIKTPAIAQCNTDGKTAGTFEIGFAQQAVLSEKAAINYEIKSHTNGILTVSGDSVKANSNKGEGPKTGDNKTALPLSAGLLISGGALVVMLKKLKRN